MKNRVNVLAKFLSEVGLKESGLSLRDVMEVCVFVCTCVCLCVLVCVCGGNKL